ncbi:2OG-Fe dioxygenase family protein [Nocardia rhamnosiphila]
MAPRYGDHAVAAAGSAVRRDGALFMPAEATRSVLGAGPQEWEHFRGHWDMLAQDRYADDRGTCRLRRYGNLSVTAATGEIRHLPHAPFVQPANSSPFYIDTDRTFEPLTDSFLSDPVFGKVLRILGQVATALDDAPVWDVKIHLFRVVAATASKGLPAPEGRAP